MLAGQEEARVQYCGFVTSASRFKRNQYLYQELVSKYIISRDVKAYADNFRRIEEYLVIILEEEYLVSKILEELRSIRLYFSYFSK